MAQTIGGVLPIIRGKQNIKHHGLDFVDCDAIWDDFTVTREDRHQDYGEARQACFDRLAGEVVVLVYKATKRAARNFAAKGRKA